MDWLSQHSSLSNHWEEGKTFVKSEDLIKERETEQKTNCTLLINTN